MIWTENTLTQKKIGKISAKKRRTVLIDVSKTKLNIRNMCKAKSVTRQQVAEHCHVSVQAVNKWWYGYGLPSIDNLFLLAELLDCSLDDLIISKHSTKRIIDN